MISVNRLIGTFLDLVAIDGDSGNENRIAKHLQNSLSKIGISSELDEASGSFSGNCGNLFAGLPGTDSNMPAILFSSHMDTIEPTIGINTIVDDGIIKTNETTILGADDRAGIAVILETLQTIIENDINHPPIKIVFTVAEEIGMFGSKFVDVEKLNAAFGFVFDSSANPGCIIKTAPSKIQISIKILGKAAHAAVSPENGVNAITIACNAISKIPTGKFDDGSTLNFGSIHGGKAINIIPAEVNIDAELRGFDNDCLTNKIDEIKDIFEKEAALLGGKIELLANEKYKAFSLPEESLPLKIAGDAIIEAGIRPELLTYSGGSDANVFNAKGLPTVNLGMGFKNCHSVNEFIKKDDLIKSAEISINIVKNAYTLLKNKTERNT